MFPPDCWGWAQNVRCGSKATVRRCPRCFRFAPESRHSSEGSACLKSANSRHGWLFDHLVGARKHGRRNGKTERLRGLEIDRQLVLGRCLYREIGGLLALEDAVDIAGRAAIHVDLIRPIGGQAAGGGEEAIEVDRGELV